MKMIFEVETKSNKYIVKVKNVNGKYNAIIDNIYKVRGEFDYISELQLATVELIKKMETKWTINDTPRD